MEADRELARRNAILGWILFTVFLVLFGSTIAVAFIYLALD
jgi:nitrogen fixation protein FixH